MDIDKYLKLVEQRQMQSMTEKEFNDLYNLMASRPHKTDKIKTPNKEFYEMAKIL